MTYRLWNGDKVDDTDPWCPVCLDLSYPNFESVRLRKTADFRRPNPCRIVKGALLGASVVWRSVPDFKHRAEEYDCEYCDALLQIIDVFWKGQNPGITVNRGVRAFKLTTREDASVEISEFLRSVYSQPLDLQLYTPSGYAPVWGRLPPPPRISPSGSSKRAYSFLQTQLDTCIREHEECRRENSLLPTRALDLGNMGLDTSQPIKLVEPRLGTAGKYIALSYCWGGSNGFRATKLNISKILQGLDEEELPATIRDAIELARYLGVRYLWVDALCIIQDDRQDWIHESGKMAAVYGQAFLTIAATSVASSRISFLHLSRENEEHLFRLRNKSLYERQKNNDEETTPSGVLGVRRTLRSGFHQNPNRTTVDPGMCRAWTLQEYLLSPRIISFSTDEVQWTCRTIRACECNNPEDLDMPRLEMLQRKITRVQGREKKTKPVEGYSNNDAIRLVMLHCYSFWNDIVERYSVRQLSCARDKLPALSGVAREYARILDDGRHSDMAPTRPSRYLAGLWEDDIYRGLCWYNPGHTSKDFLLVEYCAPSWSWASLESRVITHNEPNGYVPHAEILEAVCALANPDDPFGQVLKEGTYLKVRGVVLETKMTLTQGPLGKTPYGQLFMDCGVEGVFLNVTVFEQLGAADTALTSTDESQAQDPSPARTARRRHGRSATSTDDDLGRVGSPGESDTLPDARSGSEERREEWKGKQRWGKDILGKQFTVWLLSLMEGPIDDGIISRYVLALGRPAGEQSEVYERIGLLSIFNDIDSDDYIPWPVQEEGLIRTITIV